MKNPFAAQPGEPLPGKLDEFIEWQKEQLALAYLEQLEIDGTIDEEIEESLHAKRSIRRRWQSESGYVSIRHEITHLVTFIEENLNPYSKPSGRPKDGLQKEWLAVNLAKWEERLKGQRKDDQEIKSMEQEVFERWYYIASVGTGNQQIH
ncbi:hypothetical protein [Dyadobacter chenhuakuii]|uniref:Uncharacterized protein n=1 Tax=Dyadobacter chenhuakuii TaxID=2909339 RepID=A0ABY4XH96_9BACT|nr:hypothetical protein [Dyadobacter chenhuakuii]MCF2495771.1 hypothetical protein [Dyadobacter chenhuakuii]USJ29802.1 hypothetical protein NFI80_18195 [Dyadobacter chenhuakuii]